MCQPEQGPDASADIAHSRPQVAAVSHRNWVTYFDYHTHPKMKPAPSTNATPGKKSVTLTMNRPMKMPQPAQLFQRSKKCRISPKMRTPCGQVSITFERYYGLNLWQVSSVWTVGARLSVPPFLITSVSSLGFGCTWSLLLAETCRRLQRYTK